MDGRGMKGEERKGEESNLMDKPRRKTSDGR
jgi:hypothetical protein